MTLKGHYALSFKTHAYFGAHRENLNEDRPILSATKMWPNGMKLKWLPCAAYGRRRYWLSVIAACYKHIVCHSSLHVPALPSRVCWCAMMVRLAWILSRRRTPATRWCCCCCCCWWCRYGMFSRAETTWSATPANRQTDRHTERRTESKCNSDKHSYISLHEPPWCDVITACDVIAGSRDVTTNTGRKSVVYNKNRKLLLIIIIIIIIIIIVIIIIIIIIRRHRWKHQRFRLMR